ncbi:MAG: VOC family protein [Methanolobus sp.]|nr:VOC family protein [Methanolobus sp.]
MEVRINLITIWTDDIGPMKEFYTSTLGFNVLDDLGTYIELENRGVRFALCMREVMYDYCEEYRKQRAGQSFELAFSCRAPDEVDISYEDIISKGGKPVQDPMTMPWGQRTALFADPDGNIHEVFADLE